jgi:hypothetical protein
VEPVVRASSSLRILVVLGLVFGGVLYAQEKRPLRHVNPRVNPNIAAAQTHISRAWDYVGVAQGENNFDMNNHAANANTLLVQASKELSLAARVADSK